MRNLGWKTGRGFCPPSGGQRGWWFVWGWFTIEWHPRWWRFGIGLRPWTIGVYAGPLVLALGRPIFRWRVQPLTGTAGSGETYQDHEWTVTVTTGGVS